MKKSNIHVQIAQIKVYLDLVEEWASKAKNMIIEIEQYILDAEEKKISEKMSQTQWEADLKKALDKNKEI